MIGNVGDTTIRPHVESCLHHVKHSVEGKYESHQSYWNAHRVEESHREEEATHRHPSITYRSECSDEDPHDLFPKGNMDVVAVKVEEYSDEDEGSTSVHIDHRT